MPQLRFNPLRGEWVAYAPERNDRIFLPTDNCPLCPSGPRGHSEVPHDDFEVAVFENRFPALGPARDLDGHPPRPLGAGCEVVVYTSVHDATLANLPVERVRLLLEVWVDRYRVLSARPDVRYVYIFENKGVEMGVTLRHPHGQIYALPFTPPAVALELSSAARYRRRTARCLHCERVRVESQGPRRLFSDDAVLAYVPEAARWPYEVHLYLTRHVATLGELHDHERWALSVALLRVTQAFDRRFGFPTAYVMAVHQSPCAPPRRDDAHVHIEFYPPYRRHDRLKYLAGTELGAGTWINDTYPEDTAAELRRADAAARAAGGSC